MRKTANAAPNNSWKEAVLKEFGMTAENVRTIDVLGGEFYEEIIPESVRILSDKYGTEVIRDYEPGIIVCERYVYVKKQNNLYCFCYSGSNQQMSRKFWTACTSDINVRFIGDFIFFLKAGKIVKIFEYDLKLVMEDEKGIKICKKEVEFFVGASGQIVMPYEISSLDF